MLNENPRVAAELRSRVLKAMAELDYQPNLAARSLAGRRGYAIALLVDGSEFFREDDANAYFSPYLVDLQAGALIACREQGYHFFVEPYDFSVEGWEGGLRAQLSRIALDGVMLAPPSADRLPLLDALDDLNIPYIRFAPGLEPGRSPSVASDEDGGARAISAASAAFASTAARGVRAAAIRPDFLWMTCFPRPLSISPGTISV